MTDTPVTGSKPPARKRRRLLLWLILVLLAAAFVGGVVLAPRIMALLPSWITGAAAPPDRPAVAPSAPTDTTAAPPVGGAPVPDAAGFARDLAALHEQVARLQGEEDGSASTTQAVAAMGGQIAHMLNQLADQQNRLSDLERTSPKALVKPLAVLALSRLRQAVEQGSSYEGALDGVHRMLEGTALPETANKALLTLDAHKSEGVASALALRDSFATRIDAIIDAEALPKDPSWWDRSWAWAKGLVSARPTGDATGKDAPAIVARAETALNRGEIDRAVAELQGLSPAAAEAAAGWLRQARARQAALGAVDALEMAVLEMAAPEEEGTTP